MDIGTLERMTLYTCRYNKNTTPHIIVEKSWTGDSTPTTIAYGKNVISATAAVWGTDPQDAWDEFRVKVYNDTGKTLPPFENETPQWWTHVGGEWRVPNGYTPIKAFVGGTCTVYCKESEREKAYADMIAAQKRWSPKE